MNEVSCQMTSTLGNMGRGGDEQPRVVEAQVRNYLTFLDVCKVAGSNRIHPEQG